MKLQGQTPFIAMIAMSVSFIGPFAFAQEEPTPPPPQNIVISLQSDPLTDQEPACVVLQLGTGLLLSGQANVTVFATLDGVGISNSEVMGSPQLRKARSKFCKIVSPTGQEQDPVPLPEVLGNFLSAGGKILACPLCWVVRYGNLPESAEDLIDYNDQVYIESPIPLFLQADKVIDF